MEDLITFCCPNPACPDYGKRGLDNPRVCFRTAIFEAYAVVQEQPRTGRPKKPKKVLPKGLKYATVHNVGRCRRVVSALLRPAVAGAAFGMCFAGTGDFRSEQRQATGLRLRFKEESRNTLWVLFILGVVAGTGLLLLLHYKVVM